MKPAGEAAILIFGKEREGKQWCSRLDWLWWGDVLMGFRNGGWRDGDVKNHRKRGETQTDPGVLDYLDC